MIAACGRIDFDPTPVIGPSASGSNAIATGDSFSCAARSDGTVWCWGWAQFGQLGGTDSVSKAKPVQVAGITGATAVTAGELHACALAAGKVWCWGDNSIGELGIGSMMLVAGPQQAVLPRPAKEVVAGGYHTCALLDDASVWCWGDNSSFEVGLAAAGAVSMPAHVLDHIADVAAGAEHTCVVRADNSVWCWGADSAGQLGDSGAIGFGTSTPLQIAGVTSTQLTAGEFHTCALLDTTGYTCWGNNYAGQLGNVPPPVTGFTQLSAGGQHTCGRLASGDVMCWGDNTYGQLGTGDVAWSAFPVATAAIHDAVTVAAGIEHTCAMRADGSFACWGRGSSGELGDGTLAAWTPTKVPLVGVASVAAGWSHVCATTNAGDLTYCWGKDDRGQLGDAGQSPPDSRAMPFHVAAVNMGITQLAAGSDHSCALSLTGTMQCWGANALSQLGLGTQTPEEATMTTPGLASITTISAGDQTTCAIASAKLDCWGGDISGQQGDAMLGPTVTSPKQIDLGAAGPSAVSIGNEHVCAVTSLGYYCWGDNRAGQVGVGNTNAIVGISNVGLGSGPLAAGGDHTCARTSNGLACWGFGQDGELGDGTNTNHDTPSPGPMLAGAFNVLAAGGNNTCAIVNAQALCWGASRYGQLGLGFDGATAIVNTVPVPNAKTIAIGHDFLCVLDTGGNLYCMGDNSFGQIGNGTWSRALVPTAVALP